MKKRESFNTRWGFILACIGSAVGMGNIWMFPTRVSLYGGGAFLIPYFIFVALIGFTGVIGEMTFGRATRSGPIDAFGIACERKGKRKYRSKDFRTFSKTKDQSHKIPIWVLLIQIK